MTPLTQAAHDYLRAGLHVIALTGKRPNTTYHPHGLINAMSGAPEDAIDQAILERVFEDPATTGVGIVIQPPHVVVDIDGEQGAMELKRILGTTEIELEAPVAKTGRGLHIWYSMFPTRRSRKLGEKLDLKGVGGYVAAPPSRHPDGHTYEWINPLVEDGRMNHPIYVPDRLEDFIGKADSVAKTTRERTASTPILVIVDGMLRLGDEAATLTGLAHAVATAAEGNRNNMLFWAAASARDDGFTLSEALDVLGEAARQAGLDRDEATTAIRSAFRRSDV